MMKKLTIISLFTLVLAACSSKPEINLSESSVAYQKVHSSYLTQKYRREFSPLKDFTQEDVREIEKAFQEGNPENASLIFGALSLATGNLSGVLDLAGGAAANISSSSHPSSRSGWVISIDASIVKNGIEAKTLAMESIQEAVLETLQSKGNTLEKVTIQKDGKATLTGAYIHPTTAFQLNNKIVFGMANSHYYDDKRGFEFNANKSDYETTADTYFGGVGIGNFMAFQEGYVMGYDGLGGYEEFLKDVLSKLPSSYIYYETSTPFVTLVKNDNNADWSCSECLIKENFRLYSHIIPAIYNQGKKYEFIQPEHVTLVK